MIASWLASLVSSPLIQKVIWPALSEALSKFFESRAKSLDVKTAVLLAKNAKTADDLRDASRKLSDASSR